MEINTELGQPDETVKFSIDDKLENPNKRYDVKDEEIEEYRELLKQREAEKKQTTKTGKKGRNKAAEQEKERAEAERKAAEEKAAKESAVDSRVNMEDIPEHERRVVSRLDIRQQETDLFEEIKQIRQIELKYEKDNIKEKINKLVSDFDDEICEMQKEKYRLESDLKSADMKLILLYEELILLKSMEEKD